MSDPAHDPLCEKCAGPERKYAKEHEVRSGNITNSLNRPLRHMLRSLDGAPSFGILVQYYMLSWE